MYKTRFVVQTEVRNAAHIVNHISRLMMAGLGAPDEFRSSSDADADDPAVDTDNEIMTCTITYKTTSVDQSNQLISAWHTERPFDARVQIERLHVLDNLAFQNAFLAGRNGRALRRDLAREVRLLSELGVGTKGILEYIEECQQVIEDAKSIVESMRAPV